MRAIPRWTSFFLLCCAATAALAQTKVASFTPEGTVKKVRQVTARFSAQMVPFGDLRLADPFTFECAEKGKGRWIDGSNWSYDFERDLPAAVRCSFTLRPELRDAAGKALSGTSVFNFSTGGPAVIASAPREGGQIDEKQVFVLGLDAPALDASVTANAWCQAGGINERIGVELLKGKEREQILAAQAKFVERHLRRTSESHGTPAVAVLRCKRTFAAAKDVALIWGRGIAAPNGVATDADQKLPFRTRADFTAEFSCERLGANTQCIPFLPMRLNFSAPLSRKTASAITLTGADGTVWRAVIDKDERKQDFVSALTFPVPLPEKSSFTVALPAAVKDDAGRALVNQAQFPLAVKTDEQPPLVKFAGRFGLIEANAERMLPVTVRNVEAPLAGKGGVAGSMLRVASGAEHDGEVFKWLATLGYSYGSFNQQTNDSLAKPVLKDSKLGPTEKFTLPRPDGAAAFEVIGIALPKPGFYVVELESPKLGAGLFDQPDGRAYVNAGALVTNMVAHFKLGAESSLVWVTSLDKGKPVPNTQVAVYACAKAALWSGVTDRNGVARIPKALPRSSCKSRDYFVTAHNGDDFTFTLSSWQSGIETWRFNLPMGGVDADNRIVTTVFDRTLLRAGETVHMKHFNRRHTSTGITLARPLGKAELVHEGSDERFPMPLTWNTNGIAESDWKIPATAKQGTYAVMIGQHRAGAFRVEQFRVPTMRALLSGPKTAVIGEARVDLDLQLNYLAGGGAGLAPVKIRTVVQPRGVSFSAYEQFSFDMGDVREGVEKGSGYDEWDDECCDEGEGGANNAASAPVRQRALTLDKAGGARVSLDPVAASELPRDLVAEMSYADANGETMTASTRIPLWPSRFVVGIKPDGWVMSKEALKFQVVVLDVAGAPVAGTQVAVDYFQRTNYSHRRRLLGGFYSYENGSEVKRLGVACEGKTDAKGLLFCDVKPPADGNLILRAKAVDENQRAAVSHQDVWVAGSSDWWFTASDNDRIDLLPGKKMYAPGEEATFQVRSPFREATALVTVEREGVLDYYIRPLTGKTPTFTIPLKGNYAPNVFVSALVVRGRVAGIAPSALVDLGKPAYKLGIAAIKVGWAAHELKVQVSADKPVYKVREQATVKVKVTRPDGAPLPAGAEVALAAVDEGLLELMPNTSWNLLEAMMGTRSLQVETSTAQMQVIGKRHYGRKAFPHGGGGGKGGGRELFETLLFWKAKVTLDANGEAQVQVPVNDSLTSFRIVAVANASADLFGTGHTVIRSSQDLMLLSGLPALVREGDKLRAGATVRNASAGELKIDVGASVSADGGKARALPRQSVTLAAGQAQELGWDFQVPAGAATLAWQLDAKAVDAAGVSVSDKISVSQKVGAVTPVRTVQATLLQLDKPQTMKVQAPADALPGRGGLLTHFAARLGDDLPGVRDYMTRYPYTCFEQNTSRAVALRDEKLWKTNMARMPLYMDGDGLLRYFPSPGLGSDTLTAYVLSVAAEAGYEIPLDAREKMEAGLLGFVEGRVMRYSDLATADLAVRKVAALEALSRTKPIAAASIESFNAEPNLWPTSAVIDWYLVLQRSPALPGRAAKLAQAGQILHARLNLQGTTMTFSTERTDYWWWLMASPDVNANRLMLAVMDQPDWQKDMGRLARGAMGRMQQGHWGTTVANAWGVLAMDKFSRKFENEPVAGSTNVRLGGASKDAVWTEAKAPSQSLAWPNGAQDLALMHTGTGKPWVTVQSTAAIPLKQPISSGFRVARSVTPVQQKIAGKWSRGDVYRVRLEMEAQSDMSWVVVDDPIPASASVLGNGLGGDSALATAGQRSQGWVWPAFEERTFEVFRSYFRFVPKGKWSIEYTVRLNNQGRFNMPATHIEAMYSPEMMADSPNSPLDVGP
ncbi:MAG TPA: MG2 domain-containing protein [Telluria sp.]|jgi:hypothetical protein